MDSRAVADALGTTPKLLRQFIRAAAKANKIDVDPVGSGARYTFTADQVDALRCEFAAWSHTQASKPARVMSTTKRTTKRRSRSRDEIDRSVWNEEGDVFLPNINDPRIRAEVRERAADANARLMAMVARAGL